MNNPEEIDITWHITEEELDSLGKCDAERCDGSCPDERGPIEIVKKVRAREITTPVTEGDIQIFNHTTKEWESLKGFTDYFNADDICAMLSGKTISHPSGAKYRIILTEVKK